MGTLLFLTLLSIFVSGQVFASSFSDAELWVEVMATKGKLTYRGFYPARVVLLKIVKMGKFRGSSSRFRNHYLGTYKLVSLQFNSVKVAQSINDGQRFWVTHSAGSGMRRDPKTGRRGIDSFSTWRYLGNKIRPFSKLYFETKIPETPACKILWVIREKGLLTMKVRYTLFDTHKYIFKLYCSKQTAAYAKMHLVYITPKSRGLMWPLRHYEEVIQFDLKKLKGRILDIHISGKREKVLMR